MTTIDQPHTHLDFMWVQITKKCQQACVHCYNSSGPDGTHGTMTVADWSRAMEQAFGIGVRTVQVIGGEPTMHPQLCQMIRHAVALGLDVEVFTNMVHITEAQWSVFATQGVRLATSYYSDDPQQHARITARPTLALIERNIARAIGLGIPLRTGVIDVTAQQRTKHARNRLAELGVRDIGGDRLRRIGRGTTATTDTNAATGAGGGCAELCGNCGRGRGAILEDGTVTPCVMSHAHPVGNVHTEGLGEIMGRMPAARAQLVAAGMPEREPGRNCNPDCRPSECFPY